MQLLFFLRLRAGGIFQILQNDWFWERAVFFTILPANPGGIIVAASFPSLFVVGQWAKTVICKTFLLKLRYY